MMHFKPNFHLEIIDSEQLVLFSEDKHYLLRGSIYVAIGKLLQTGSRPEEEIIEGLLPRFPLECISEALKRLKQRGFVSNVCDQVSKNVLAFWSDLKLDDKIQVKSNFSIKNFSIHNSSAIVKALESLSLKIDDSGDFFIVMVDNYVCEELEEFNKARLLDKKPWMLLKPSGRVIWIGPIFEPGRTGCWNCLAEKIKENRRVEVDLFGLNNRNLNVSSLVYLPTTLIIAMNMAANEVAKWEKSPQSHQLHQNLLTLDAGNMEMRLHSFKTLNTCTSCQPIHQKTTRQFPNLQPSPKKYFFDEGERSCSFDDTLETLKDNISPITGMISSISHSIINDEHICYSVRTLPLPSEHICHERYIRIPDVATGKGKTKLQATVGCIAEAIERYNCTFTKQKEIRCTYEDIKHEAIHPYSLLNFSEYQYDNRDEINVYRSGFNKIPKRYDGSAIGWTGLHSMTHDRICYIPSSYCYLSYPFENDVEICPGNSNGCASGNSLEEAIFYALLELVERDSVAIWWYNRIKRPHVDLDSFNDPSFNQIKQTFKKNNRKLFVLDITTDLKIPSYVAVSWKSDGSRIFFGTGSHLQPRVGIARAISELNQIMIRANTPKNVDLNTIVSVERDLVKWTINENIADHSYMVPQGGCHPEKLFPQTDDFLTDINLIIEKLKSLNFEVFLFDLTNPNIRLHTARVVIPGLRHFWSRLGPGRLYDTPVHLKWIKKPLVESELNPTPYFL